MAEELVVAAFASAGEAVAAASRVRALGYVAVEAYTPFPVPELDDALGLRRTALPRWVLAAGAFGAAAALFVEWWTNGIDYPLNVGGRPIVSWPTHVVIVFESAVLFAAVTAFACALFMSGLPRLHAPIFDVEGIERTSLDRFWITIADLDHAQDAIARAEWTDLRDALLAEGAVDVRRVEP